MADKKVFKRRKRGGRSCAAGAPNNQSCRNRTFTPGISMHQFPVDPAIRDQWVKFVRQHRPEFHESSSKYHSLCSAHFEDHCYVHNLSVVGSVLEGAGFKLQKMLSREAIPTKDASTNVTERARDQNEAVTVLASFQSSTECSKMAGRKFPSGGHYCAARGPCNTNCESKTGTPSISMHYFPVDETLRQKWIQFVRVHRKDFVPRQKSTLCSVHFDESCFGHRSISVFDEKGNPIKLRRYLIKGSIPTDYSVVSINTSQNGRSETRRVKLPITTLNQHVTCRLCNGYLVDAATITECLHTFCKSCLVRHIELVNRCPTCNTLIHESQPLYNIRLDRTMQDIVYKLLPRLEREEKRRERKFYKDRQLPYPVPKVVASQTLPVPGPSKAIKKQKAPIAKTSSKTAVTKSYHRTDEQISLQLETFRDGSGGPAKIEPLQKKYMRLSTQVTIGLIQRFLAAKLQLKSENMVGILYDKTEMGKDLTLKYINDNLSPQEEHSSGPLILHYRALDIKT